MPYPGPYSTKKLVACPLGVTTPLTVADVGWTVTGGPVAAPGRRRTVHVYSTARVFPAASGPSSSAQLKRTPGSASLNANRPPPGDGTSSNTGAGGGVASIVHVTG